MVGAEAMVGEGGAKRMGKQVRWRWRYVPVCVMTVALGVGVLLYRGPGVSWIRGMLGDVLVVVLMHFALGAIWSAHWRWRALVSLVIAAVVECIQLLKLVQPEDPFWMHLIFGSTFDPMDLLAYVLGAVAAVGLEVVLDKRLQGPSPKPS